VYILVGDGPGGETLDLESHPVELKELGGTGVMVPEIGLGTWKYTGGNEPLRRGIELGAFLIDTAEMYRTEDAVGRAVKGIRERVFIATKVSGSNLRYDRVLRAAENSLRLLDTGYIDLYQIHWPNSGVPIAETMRAMEELVDGGMVKYIGVSNFSVGELAEAAAVMTRYPIVSNQVLYNLKRRDIELELLPYCQQNGITVLAYTPLADGSLAVEAASPDESGRARRRTADRFGGRQRERDALRSVAAEVGRTPAQVALNWCIARPNVVAIPKSNSLARTGENCGASGWRLTEDQRRLLDQAFPV
jgi:diketogulonate reductase-like aldo/keto reductase